MSLGKYLVWVAALVALSSALVLPLLSPEGRLAMLVGASLAALNSVAAYGLVIWAGGRPIKAFMTAILGGMLVRMTVVLGALLLGVLVLDLQRVPLIFSLLGHFAALLALEMTVVHRRTNAQVLA